MNSAKAVSAGFFWVLLLICGIRAVSAQSSFSKGEELFIHNKPQEALSYLEAAVKEDPAHVQAFLYLGIAYLQVNRADDAIAAYKSILPRGGSETARIAFSLGNAYFAKGNPDLARQYYTQAIEADVSYSSAYLNRANSLVKSGELPAALADYEAYLQREPGSPQRDKIVRLQAFIREEIAAAERRRVMAEEAARVEAERVRAEAERRRKLLEEVTESLQAAAEDSKGLSAGTEDVQDYDGEFELD